MNFFAIFLTAAAVVFPVRQAIFDIRQNRRRNLTGSIGIFLICAVALITFVSVIFMEKTI